MPERHIWLSVPAYRTTVEPETDMALYKAVHDFEARGWKRTYHKFVGDGLLANARNGIVAEFLQKSDATDLIMVDDDVAWEDGALARLVEHPVDFVAAVVPKKNHTEDYPVMWLDRPALLTDPDARAALAAVLGTPEAEGAEQGPGLLEVAAVGAAIVRLTREGLERMVAHYADREYAHMIGIKAWCLYDCGLHQGLYWGEDTTFCRRWREMGAKVWIDPEIATQHVGYADPMKPERGRKVYAGHIGNWLRHRAPASDTPAEDQDQGQDKSKSVGPLPTVALCIASRGRPESLRHVVRTALERATLPETRIVIALDGDDDALPGLYGVFGSDKVVVSTATREDSLGEKYNRCWRAHKADLYAIGTDDVEITTKGWDVLLAQAAARFEDGFGIVYFAGMNGALPYAYAISHKMAERVGYLQTPYFPTWWHDTWTAELAEMVGRVAHADVALRLPREQKSRGLRDVVYWQDVYDRLRDLRIAAAHAVIDDPAFTGNRIALKAAIPAMLPLFHARCAPTRNPESAARFEVEMGFDAPDDLRVRRLKERAEAMLATKDAA